MSTVLWDFRRSSDSWWRGRQESSQKRRCCSWAGRRGRVWETAMFWESFSPYSRSTVWSRAWMWGKVKVRVHIRWNTGNWRMEGGTGLANRGYPRLERTVNVLSVWWQLFFSLEKTSNQEVKWSKLYLKQSNLTLKHYAALKVQGDESEMMHCLDEK